jgi:hypothetical protein
MVLDLPPAGAEAGDEAEVREETWVEAEVEDFKEVWGLVGSAYAPSAVHRNPIDSAFPVRKSNVQNAAFL